MDNNEKTGDDEQLTPQQVEQTLGFFEAFSNGIKEQGFGGTNFLYPLLNKYYTPETINQAMQSINMNPSIPTENGIKDALANPRSSEKVLKDYATYFELNNIFYKRLINFNSDLLAWNLTFDCINIEDDKEIFSEEYKKDLKVIDKICGRFNFKEENSKVVKQIFRQGVFYGVLRDEDDFFSWQELPSDYCRITGKSCFGSLFSFNFAYFISLVGTNIEMFPKSFKKLYRALINQMGDDYNPKGNIKTRHKSYVYWMDVSPEDNFFCFTIDDNITTLVPYYSALFPDLYLQPMMRDLEKNKAMVAAQKMLVGLIETYDKNKSGTAPNQYKISPTDLGRFLQTVKQALGETVKGVMLPAKSAEVVDFRVEEQNRYTNYQRNVSANSVSSSASMLTENKLNAYETQIALTIDENFVKSLYGQFEKALNFYINKYTNKYKFRFKFNDTNTSFSTKERNGQFQTFASMGLVDINLYARATNQNVFEAVRSLQMTKVMGLDKQLISLMSLNNQSKEKKNGRPESEDSLNESTMLNKERASNEENSL